LRDKPCYVRDEDGRFELVNRPVHVGFDGASSTWSRFRRALAENSEFFDRVWNAFRDKRAERRSARESYLGNLPFEQICARISDPTTATNWLLGQIAQRCKAIDAPLLAFVGTHKHDRYLYDPRAKPPKDLVEPVQTAPTRALAEAGKQHGFETLSVDQALYEDIKRGEMLHVGDGHFNARGHQIVARVLGGWLRTHGYLDEEASSKSPENSSR
jgi:hypothetical protein